MSAGMNVICTDRLTKRYGHTTALDALDLTIEQSEVFGYLGPNGAGKSTTIALLLGLIRSTSGTASIFGLDVWRDAPTIHRRVAYVPSESNLWPSLTGAEALEFLGNVHGSVDRRVPRRACGALRPRTRQEDSRIESRQPPEGGADRQRSRVGPSCCCSTSRPPGWTRSWSRSSEPVCVRPVTAARPYCCRRTS